MRLIKFTQLLLLILLPLGFCNATAQEIGNCTVKLAQLPRAGELRGFHLGMSADEFKARAPQLKLARTDAFGSSAVNVFPAFEPKIDPATFAELKTVSLEFLDNKLTSLWIGYEGSFKWQTMDEFTTGISAALKLPAAWSAGSGARSSRLNCDDFTVIVAMIGQSPSLKLIDKAAQVTLDKRKAAAEEKADQPQ
ncbi:MAG: hypothetical protein WKF30_00750 [Pyrinomonadaceae bacterium]